MKKNKTDLAATELLFMDLDQRPIAKLAVTRTEPKWCAQYLGTIDIEEEHQVLSDIIRSRFGGCKFRIKIMDGYGVYLRHTTMTLPEQPRLNGLPITNETTNPIHALPPPAIPLELEGDNHKLRKMIANLTDHVGSLDGIIKELVSRIEEVVGKIEEMKTQQIISSRAVQEALKMREQSFPDEEQEAPLAKLREDKRMVIGPKTLEKLLLLVAAAWVKKTSP